jgi:hypothetical protein
MSVRLRNSRHTRTGWNTDDSHVFHRVPHASHSRRRTIHRLRHRCPPCSRTSITLLDPPHSSHRSGAGNTGSVMMDGVAPSTYASTGECSSGTRTYSTSSRTRTCDGDTETPAVSADYASLLRWYRHTLGRLWATWRLTCVLERMIPPYMVGF